MKYRKLGQGLEVSAIGIGCMPMIQDGNIAYGKVDLSVAQRTIHEAIALGITFFDTAEMYGPFTNEELVGRHQEQARGAGHRHQVRDALGWLSDAEVTVLSAAAPVGVTAGPRYAAAGMAAVKR